MGNDVYVPSDGLESSPGCTTLLPGIISRTPCYSDQDKWWEYGLAYSHVQCLQKVK